MKLTDLSEEDLNGILFVYFPDSVSLRECRDALELLVCDCHDDFCERLAEDEKPELCLNPFWVTMALSRKNWNEVSRMSDEVRNKNVEWAMEERRKRMTDAGKAEQGASRLTNPD